MMFYLMIGLQLACIFHAMRNGNSQWIMVLLIPGIGALAYGLAFIMPELFGSFGLRRTARGVMKKIDPWRDVRKMDRDLQRTDNIENRLRIATECLDLKDYDRAEQLYRETLVGFYEHEPQAMLGLAQAQFGLNKYVETKQTLDELIGHNPDFRSAVGHLLFARTLEALGDIERAQVEYEVVKDSFVGEEARVRFAAFLLAQNKTRRAAEILQEIEHRCSVAPAHYQKTQKPWRQQAAQMRKHLEAS
jgi:hypothetical protein